MSEMPNLDIWNASTTYLRKEADQVRMSVRTYIKHELDDFSNSTVIAEANVIFSVESFADYVQEMITALEKIKAELAEVAEVA